MSGPTEKKTSVSWGKPAAIVCVIFLIGFAICAGLAAVDKGHRSKLETMKAEPLAKPKNFQ